MEAATQPLFDKSRFDVAIPVQALRIPKAKVAGFLKRLKGHAFDRPRLRSVVVDPEDPSGPDRLLLLHEKYQDPDLEELPSDVRDDIRTGNIPICRHEVKLNYDYFNADYILKELLPDGVEVPSSFETVGHVAHLNLRDDLLSYKALIGAVLLEKNAPKIRSIVNKVGTIENTFRVQELELLAGQDDLVTQVKQHGAVFRLDFRLVYWNSRLEREHARLVDRHLHGWTTTVCDMMAGIGPFAIPAAIKGCQVYANDLNPDSTRYLAENARLNKVDSRVHVHTMDAREFVRHLLAPVPAGESKDGEESGAASGGAAGGAGPVIFDHVVMNLPATAIEFLDVFKGAFRGVREAWSGQALPRVHCYLFARSNETDQDIIQRGEHHLGGALEDPEVVQVRDVAPNKLMYCLSFTISAALAFSSETNAASRKRARDEE